MTRLNAASLSVAYDETEVVHGLTLDLPEGKVTAIVGANASGKSTLLRALARLLRPSGGLVYLDGADSPDSPV
ncbi:MAG: ATP-binding cassette domain-containing protein [Actinomycetota bacterium]